LVVYCMSARFVGAHCLKGGLDTGAARAFKRREDLVSFFQVFYKRVGALEGVGGRFWNNSGFGCSSGHGRDLEAHQVNRGWLVVGVASFGGFQKSWGLNGENFEKNI
jgi:hypothetical protein